MQTILAGKNAGFAMIDVPFRIWKDGWAAGAR